jgi:hypothetical protein
MQKLYALQQLTHQTILQKMVRHRISANILGITWTEIWLIDGSADVAQLLGLLGRQI